MGQLWQRHTAQAAVQVCRQEVMNNQPPASNCFILIARCSNYIFTTCWVYSEMWGWGIMKNRCCFFSYTYKNSYTFSIWLEYLLSKLINKEKKNQPTLTTFCILLQNKSQFGPIWVSQLSFHCYSFSQLIQLGILAITQNCNFQKQPWSILSLESYIAFSHMCRTLALLCTKQTRCLLIAQTPTNKSQQFWVFDDTASIRPIIFSNYNSFQLAKQIQLNKAYTYSNDPGNPCFSGTCSFFQAICFLMYNKFLNK